LASFLAQPAAPAGWTASFQDEYSINRPLFGQSSRWFRYLYSPTSPGLTSLHSTLPVTADVINAGGLGGFDQYGVTACYSFHGYTLRDVAKVGLGEGVSGQALSYAGANTHQDWSIVYWVWPVKMAGHTRYERIILYLQNTSSAHVSVSGDTHGVAGLKGALTGANTVQHRLLVNRAFLVAFAREIIHRQSTETDAGLSVAALPAGGSTVSWLTASDPSGRQKVLAEAGRAPSATSAAAKAAAAAGSTATLSPASGGVLAQYAQFWHQYALMHPRPGVTPRAQSGGQH
jgi:hypothetical protein